MHHLEKFTQFSRLSKLYVISLSHPHSFSIDLSYTLHSLTRSHRLHRNAVNCIKPMWTLINCSMPKMFVYMFEIFIQIYNNSLFRKLVNVIWKLVENIDSVYVYVFRSLATVIKLGIGQSNEPLIFFHQIPLDKKWNFTWNLLNALHTWLEENNCKNTK